MTGGEADEPSSGSRIWRNRLGFYLLVQASIVLACILLLRLPLPEPSARYGLTEAVLVDGEIRRPVGLPYHLPPLAGQPQLLALSFERPP